MVRCLGTFLEHIDPPKHPDSGLKFACGLSPGSESPFNCPVHAHRVIIPTGFPTMAAFRLSVRPGETEKTHKLTAT